MRCFKYLISYKELGFNLFWQFEICKYNLLANPQLLVVLLS